MIDGSVQIVTRSVFDVVPSRGGSAASAFSYILLCVDTVCTCYPCIGVRGAPLSLEGPSGIFS